MASDYWGEGYWGSGYWGSNYWGVGGTAAPPEAPTVSVGAYRPRMRRAETSVEAIALCALVLGPVEANAVLVCDLLNTIAAEGLVTGEFRRRVEQVAVIVAQNRRQVMAEGVAVATLTRELREMVRLEGRVDTLKVLALLKILEEM